MNYRIDRTLRATLTTAAVLLVAPFSRIVAQDVMATSSDPRVGLAPGFKNTAGIAASNMKVISYSPKPAQFDSATGLSFINSDMAFGGHYVYQGNFRGFMVWDVANPAAPVLKSTVVCKTDQGDPSIYGNLLFISAESGGARTDCGSQTVTNPADRERGVRIFDVSDPSNPKLIKNIQTCRGSHTHTFVPSPTDKNIMYIYVGGSSQTRDSSEIPELKCSPGAYDPKTNPDAATSRIDIIKVPLDHPEQAAVITYARIFEGLAPRAARGGGGGGGGGGNRGRGNAAADTSAAGRAGAGGRGAVATAGRGAAGRGANPAPAGRGAGGPGGCHDMTAYPAYHLVAASCGSHGILLNVTNPEKPIRLDAISDSNFSLWHTAIFSNDAKKVVYTDEWGGGTAPNCKATDPRRLGGNTVLTIDAKGKYAQHDYFKMLAAQSATENCVSHNGGLVPVPGRDIMAQGWYQGGVDIFDFTNPDHTFEIAYFDRGPVPQTPGANSPITTGGSWGAYYWNGYIYSSELSRGLDILELTPSDNLSQNEIDAAKLAHMDEYNPQSQTKIVWTPGFPVVRSYLDQMTRNQGVSSARLTALTNALKSAEKAAGPARKAELAKIALSLDKDALTASDKVRVKAMAAAVRELAAATK